MGNKVWSIVLDIIKTAIGCALFAVGFSLFLLPGGMNAGGLSGLAMVFVHVTGIGTVGIISALMNVPLFIIGGVKIGKNTVVRNSILFQDTFTGENVILDNVITDKNVVIRDNRVLSGAEDLPYYIPKGKMI